MEIQKKDKKMINVTQKVWVISIMDIDNIINLLLDCVHTLK